MSPVRERQLGRWLDAALIISMGMLFILSAALVQNRRATAYHPHNPGVHLLSQHSGANEEFCVWIEGPSYLTHSSAFYAINDTLYLDNQSEDWDTLAWDGNAWRVFWDPLNSEYEPCYPNRYGAYFDAQYRIQNDQSSHGCGQYNCVYQMDPVSGPLGHQDFNWFLVYLRSDGVRSVGGVVNRHAINHETGHVLGLQDGGPLAPGYDRTCTQSIMHSAAYGCGVNYLWPQPDDRFNVDYISLYSWP